MLRDNFLAKCGFKPDKFQIDAFDIVDEGHNIVVAAPTGSGKTLVANYAIENTLEKQGRIFYTTPIKALSNQKYHDLVAEYGKDKVGLLTGDTAVNSDAPVVVMTTEVLRNMIYAGDELKHLQSVVLDEVHYLQDAYRGGVWEEVIIHLPYRVQLVCLSATVSNADEVTDWLETVRGSSKLVVETKRPVELENYYMIAEAKNNKLHLIKTAKGTKPNSDGFNYDPDVGRRYKRGSASKGGARGKRRWATPSRLDVVLQLNQREMLPAIYFVFSRNGCDDSAYSVAKSGLVLTTNKQKERIREIISEKTGSLSEEDLAVLKFDDFKYALEVGVAPHHAGMVPAFKETVEACFIEGLLKVVFATETLALGINMPARTVVIDKLTKFTGETHEFLTPSQFTQLTGRAGRRGLDSKGKAITLWSPFVNFKQVAELSMSKDFVLTSSFRPTYNMAANLVRSYEYDHARHLLNLSFAQFRADASVVRSEQGIETIKQRRDRVVKRLEKEFGPIEELRQKLTLGEAPDPGDILFGLSQLVPGEVCLLEGVAPSIAVVVATYSRKGGQITAKFVDRDGNTHEVKTADLETIPKTVGLVEIPEPYLPNSVAFASEVAENMGKLKVVQDHLSSKGKSGSSNSPLSPQARKGLTRLDKLNKEISKMQSSSSKDSASLGVQFDKVVHLLEERSHLADWTLTPSGERIARLYHECDLFVVEAMDSGVFDGLNPAELAGLASAFCYEERRKDYSSDPWFPSPELKKKFSQAQGIHMSLTSAEGKNSLALTRPPDAGFMAIAHGWASGGDLEDVLRDEELRVGDFIRTSKQLVDLLRQLTNLASNPETRSVARQSVKLVYRDLIEASSMLDPSVLDSPDPDPELEQDPEQDEAPQPDPVVESPEDGN